MQKWEYATVKVRRTISGDEWVSTAVAILPDNRKIHYDQAKYLNGDHLNELGNDGWELAGTTPVRTEAFTATLESVVVAWILYFKRPKEG